MSKYDLDIICDDQKVEAGQIIRTRHIVQQPGSKTGSISARYLSLGGGGGGLVGFKMILFLNQLQDYNISFDTCRIDEVSLNIFTDFRGIFHISSMGAEYKI